MPEINLLRRYPRAQRPLEERAAAQTPENIKIAREYGREFFDGGDRNQGYGRYVDDGRWAPVASDMFEHFGLASDALQAPGDTRFLDVGCAKGFLVKEMLAYSIEPYGLDISDYALKNCAPEVIGRLHLGNCTHLPFPDNSFQAVVSINTVHNLERGECIQAVREIQRVSGGRAYIQVDSYRTLEERERFLRWVLTARTHYWPGEWEQLFHEAGYTGGHGFTVVD